MAVAADKSAKENRWVQFKEIIEEAKNETTTEKLRAIHPTWVVERSASFHERVQGVFSSKRRESVKITD